MTLFLTLSELKDFRPRSYFSLADASSKNHDFLENLLPNILDKRKNVV